MPFEEARKYINPPPKKKQRRVRRNCPKITPWNPPKRISKKARNGGRCDYLTPEGTHCSHWQAPMSLACWCHREAYEGQQMASVATVPICPILQRKRLRLRNLYRRVGALDDGSDHGVLDRFHQAVERLLKAAAKVDGIRLDKEKRLLEELSQMRKVAGSGQIGAHR